MNRSITTISFLLLGGVAIFAARVVEKRENATNVFTGKVKTVHVEKKNGFLDYVIDLTIESVEKGEGIKTGDLVPLKCYLRDPDWLKGKSLSEEEKRADAMKRDSSYRAVPKEGETIKVYARKLKQDFEGIYPDWFDPIKS